MRPRLSPAVLLVLFAALALPAAAQTAPVTIDVDAAHPTGPYTPVWNYFGADEPNYAYAPSGRQLLGELSKASPAPVYIRLHNLLTTGDGSSSLKWGSTNAYTEDANGKPVYDWTLSDKIFDAIVDANTVPIVEVGFMPEALSTHPKPYRHTFPDGSVFTGWSYPPKDYERWSALVSAWTEHLRDRYSWAFVDSWLWEVWNEPDIDYWHGSPQEYDKLYDTTAAAIQKVLPNAKIGGPESTGTNPGRSEAFLRQFLEHCAHGKNAATGKTGAPLGFISFHPKGSPKFLEAAEGKPAHVRMDIRAQLRATDLGMKVVASFPEWKHTPIILGESDPEGCAACKGPQNGYRNGPLYGVSVAEATALQTQLAQRHGVNLQGAVTWAFEFEDQPLFAGFRELATSGHQDGKPFLIDKPVLNVFRMMGMMVPPLSVQGGVKNLPVTSSGALPIEQVLTDSVRTSPDIEAVATGSAHEVDILLWNYHDDDLAAAASTVAVQIHGLPATGVRSQQWLMDATHSNAYAIWQQQGSPAHPTAAQIAAIQQAAKLEPLAPAKPIDVNTGAATLKVDLNRQAVTLLRLTW